MLRCAQGELHRDPYRSQASEVSHRVEVHPFNRLAPIFSPTHHIVINHIAGLSGNRRQWSDETIQEETRREQLYVQISAQERCYKFDPPNQGIYSPSHLKIPMAARGVFLDVMAEKPAARMDARAIGRMILNLDQCTFGTWYLRLKGTDAPIRRRSVYTVAYCLASGISN